MSKSIVLKSTLAIVMVGFVLSYSSCKKKEEPKPTDTSVSPPSNLSVTDITETSVRLIWAGVADSYEILLTNQHATEIPISSTTNTCLVTDLTENTTYTWKIRAKKGNNYSQWIEGPSFTTTQGTPETHEIVGTWKYETIEIKEIASENPLLEIFIKTAFQEYGIDAMVSEQFEGTFEFTENGELIHQTSTGSGVSNYSINGNKLTITDSDIFSGTVNFSISGKTMYWDLDIIEMASEFGVEDLLGMVIEMGVTKIILRITLTK